MKELLHERVAWDVDEVVAIATLSRPEAGNGFDRQMAQGIREAAERIHESGRDGNVRAAVIAAEGAAFSVGGDLQHFADAADPTEAMRAVADDLHAALMCLTTAPVPVVTAIDGVVAGGGIGLALAGDITLAGPRGKFRMAYTAAGLSPDCGTSWLLPRRIGLARAFDLTLTNRPLTAAEALQSGLVSRLVEEGDVTQQALELARELSAGAGEALAQAKRLLWESTTRDLPAHLDDEAITIARLIAEADGREGIGAFLAKRKPQFR